MLTEQSAANDVLATENYLTRASTGKRLANYLIDIVVFYILIFLVSFVIALINPATIEDLTEDRGFAIGERLLSLVLYALYMSVTEALFKGSSVGKLITGTKAVNMDGTPISAGTAFGRGFSRAVPFCAFSALGSPCNPWQDQWTNTMVIDKKQSVIQA